jgi:hypothetical protein
VSLFIVRGFLQSGDILLTSRNILWEPTLARSVSAKITCMQILHRPCKTDQICASCATASAWPIRGRHVAPGPALRAPAQAGARAWLHRARAVDGPGHPAPDACPGLLCCFSAWASMHPAWAPPDATSKRPIGQPHRWFLRGGQVLPARAHLACCACLSEYTLLLHDIER